MVREAAPQLDLIAVAVVVVVVPVVGTAAGLVEGLLCRQQQRLGQSSLEHVPSL